MHRSVIDAWHRFSEPLEGRVHWMYLDVLGLVTTGVGNLIDPVMLAQRLPWKHADGMLANDAEIAAQWHALKARQDLKKLHFKYAADVTTLRLSDADIDAVVVGKLAENERVIKKVLTDFDLYPADAQIAIMSIAWAVGPGFTKTFKNFTRAAMAHDWNAAVAACGIRTEGNPGVIPRNKANALCLKNAARVVEFDLPVEELHWPAELGEPLPKPPALPGISDADRALANARFVDYARRVTAGTASDGLAELAGEIAKLEHFGPEDETDTLPPDTEPARS